MRDVSSPSVYVAGRWIVTGWCVQQCVCECACMGKWGKRKGHGKADREVRCGEGVQYSICKLALYEEVERYVENVLTSMHVSMCVCVCA